MRFSSETLDGLRQIARNLEGHSLLEGVYLDTAVDSVIPISGEEPPPLDESRSRLAPPAGEWNYPDVNWSDEEELYLASGIPYRNWYLKFIRAPKAWDITRGSRDHSRIAVVDSGFDARHEDLVANVLVASQLMHSDNLPSWRHHGTSVAGLAAATGGNNRGVSGVSWFASLHLFGTGLAQAEGYPVLRSLWIAGLISAADSGARVVNLSLGSGPYTPDQIEKQKQFYRPAIEYAKQRNCLMVMAAGNSARDAGEFLPQAFANDPELRDHVLVVGACDIDGTRSSFSNHGPLVEIYAPGGNNFPAGHVRQIFTTVPGGYGQAGVGTSYAAPLVTGTVGLLLAVNPSLSAPDLKRLILRGGRVRNGLRLLDAANAVALAASEANHPIASLTADPSVFAGAPASVTFDLRGSVPRTSVARAVLDFGDGTPPQAIAPDRLATTVITHRYTSEGIYRATLTLQDSAGASLAKDTLVISIGRTNVDIIVK
ncbi:MAG: S8 family serine peptidase [Fimbriimonadales bacterium]|nr:S8 family serine peptidase [Fimbriimonadales bacterium]